MLSRASLAENELDTEGVQGRRKHDGYEVAIAKARVKTSGTTCLQRGREKGIEVGYKSSAFESARGKGCAL